VIGAIWAAEACRAMDAWNWGSSLKVSEGIHQPMARQCGGSLSILCLPDGLPRLRK
jgi:hypothetical protein